MNTSSNNLDLESRLGEEANVLNRVSNADSEASSDAKHSFLAMMASNAKAYLSRLGYSVSAGHIGNRPVIDVEEIYAKILENEKGKNEEPAGNLDLVHGASYDEEVLHNNLTKIDDIGEFSLYKPRTVDRILSNVDKLYFRRERKGTKLNYVLKRIELKEQNAAAEIVRARVCDEDGGLCRDFIPGGKYSLSTIDTYLEQVSSEGGFQNSAVFQSKAHNGNGHYYLFSVEKKIGMPTGFYFIAAITKEMWDIEKENPAYARAISSVGTGRH